MTDLTLPGGLGAGTDWNDTLQKIVAYGAGRFADTYAVDKLYQASNNTPLMMDQWGNVFPQGQLNSAYQTQQSGTFPMIFLMIGGAFLFLMLAKD
ncbi:MAG: hypothetical protein ACTS9Y_13405 [Methylophilus sp.]|uniref:hypothetical protein n=1 Tax=Methylophilus sp. TaxID=29541 RepID=UPI003FA07D05